MHENENRRTIHFTCPCGMKLKAIVAGPRAFAGATIAFQDRSGAALEFCPNCRRDFRSVTAEEFLAGVWT